VQLPQVGFEFRDFREIALCRKLLESSDQLANLFSEIPANVLLADTFENCREDRWI